MMRPREHSLLWVKLGGKGTFSTRPVMLHDRTLRVLIASSDMCYSDIKQGGLSPHLAALCNRKRLRRGVPG